MPPNIASIYDQLQSVDGEREALIGQLSAPTQPAVASNGTAIAAALPALIAGLFGGKSDLSAFAQGGSAALSAANEQAQQQQTREDMRKQLMLSLLDKKEGRLLQQQNAAAKQDRFEISEANKFERARINASKGPDTVITMTGNQPSTEPHSRETFLMQARGFPALEVYGEDYYKLHGEYPSEAQLERRRKVFKKDTKLTSERQQAEGQLAEAEAIYDIYKKARKEFPNTVAGNIEAKIVENLPGIVPTGDATNRARFVKRTLGGVMLSMAATLNQGRPTDKDVQYIADRFANVSVDEVLGGQLWQHLINGFRLTVEQQRANEGLRNRLTPEELRELRNSKLVAKQLVKGYGDDGQVSIDVDALATGGTQRFSPEKQQALAASIANKAAGGE